MLSFSFSVLFAPLPELTAECLGQERVPSVQRRKWSPTGNDPQTGNDPRIGPQMIPNRKWHFSIPQHLNDQIEPVQRRALRIARPHVSYSDRLEATNIQTLNQRREDHCHKLYKNIFIQEDNKLKNLIPVPKLHKYCLRTPRTFDLIKCRTERLKSSFIPKSISKWGNLNI